MNIEINRDELSDKEVLPIDGLSGNAQRIVQEVADVYQCSRDIVLAAVFGAVGVALGKKVKIDSGKHTNYPCLWLCVVAPSGANKSTPVRFILQPLKDRDVENYKEYQKELKAFKEAKDEQKEKPTFKQLLLSDSTPEARNQVLSACPNGILLYRDEIKGFLDDMGRYNKSGEASQLLSVFDFDNIIVNRKSDDTLLIKEPFMSILGTIQPDVLASTFGSDLFMNNGFNQRWLFVYPESTPPAMYSDKAISKEVREAWSIYINGLLDADFEAMGCSTVCLTDEAKEIYKTYYNELQIKKSEHEEDSYMCAVYSKLQIQVLRWALITHFLGDNIGMTRILPSDMGYAVRCMRYFERCAEKVYEKLVGSRTRTEAKAMTKEQLIAMFYNTFNPKSKQGLADAIGISRQAVSRAVNKFPMLRCCGCDDALSVDNKDNIEDNSATL